MNHRTYEPSVHAAILAGAGWATLMLAGCEPGIDAERSASSSVPTEATVARASVSASAAANASAPAGPSLRGSSNAPVPVSTVLVRGSIDHQPVELTFARATPKRFGIEVELSDGALPCGGSGPKRLGFTVAPDVKGTFFEGSTFSLSIDPLAPYAASSALVRVDRYDPDQRRLRGELAVFQQAAAKPRDYIKQADLRGTFDVALCPAEKDAPLRAPGPIEPLSEVGSGIAFRAKESRPGTVDEIWLFSKDRPFSCATPAHPNRHSFVIGSDIGVAELGGMRKTGPQPVRALFHEPAPDSFVTGGSADPMGFAQIEWVGFDPKPGRELRGELTIFGYDLKGGTRQPFRAKVCP